MGDPPQQNPTEAEMRRKRQAAALRENLKRRKARDRAAPDAESGEGRDD